MVLAESISSGGLLHQVSHSLKHVPYGHLMYGIEGICLGPYDYQGDLQQSFEDLIEKVRQYEPSNDSSFSDYSLYVVPNKKSTEVLEFNLKFEMKKEMYKFMVDI